ncbi:SDR family NAD(P)-dependent oxidoreductase, partial [Klebsiella pneumoniae]|nr:SDR family NAD(P)-dependent oxidoreductase [Klebsiella pneumoniae]
ATVMITARNQPEEPDESLNFIPADLSRPENAAALVNQVLGKFGRLDLLINNLGGSETPGGGFAALTAEDWELSIRTNL